MSTILRHPTEEKISREYPNDMEAEQAVLGAVLANNEAMNHVVIELRPEHFYAGIHQRIFRAILDFRSTGMVFTPVTIMKNSHNSDNPIDGPYLARLVAASVSIVNIHDYSKMIAELSLRRSLMAAAENILFAGYENKSSGEMSEMMAATVSDITRHTSLKKTRNSRESGIAFIESLSEPNLRTSTGIPRFDRAMGGGLRRGQAYGLAAAPGHGKTMMAGTISHNLNYSGHRHLFIAGEMGDEEIHARSIARKVGCANETLYDEDVTMFSIRTDAARVAMEDPANVIYQSEAFLTFDNLKQFVASAVARHNIEGFILDYIQLVRGMAKGTNLVMHLEEVSQWIAAACKQYNIWSLTTSQLNEGGSTRWGDGIKMAFSNLFYLHRVNEAGETDKTSNLAWIETEKARHTKFMNVGSPKYPSLIINENGPFFEHYHTADVAYSALKA